MFMRALSELRLASKYANSLFPEIIGDIEYNGDRSYMATLRALMHPRVTEGFKPIHVCTLVCPPIRRTVAVDSLPNLVFSDAHTFSNTLAIVAFNNGRENDEKIIKLLDGESPETSVISAKSMTGFRVVPDTQKWLESRFVIRQYTNEEKNTTIVVIPECNLAKWHMIQAFTPRFMPKVFPKFKPMNEREKNIIIALANRSGAQDYENAMNEIADEYGDTLREACVRGMLGDVEKRARETQLQNAQNREKEVFEGIESLDRQYREYSRRLDEIRINIAGLKAMIKSGCSSSSELIDFVVSMKNVEIVSCHDRQINLIIDTYLDNYDAELYSTISENEDSFMWEDCGSFSGVFEDNPENCKKVLDAIFSEEPLLRVKTCSYFSLDLAGSVTSERGYRFGTSRSDRIPNPHLEQHNCIGDNKPAIQGCLRDGDTVGAIAQCIASAKSINVSESATFPGFMEVLFNSNKKVLESMDGQELTPTEALELLNQ